MKQNFSECLISIYGYWVISGFVFKLALWIRHSQTPHELTRTTWSLIVLMHLDRSRENVVLRISFSGNLWTYFCQPRDKRYESRCTISWFSTWTRIQEGIHFFGSLFQAFGTSVTRSLSRCLAFLIRDGLTDQWSVIFSRLVRFWCKTKLEYYI